MKFDLSLVISVAAILVMVACLYEVIRLRGNIPGGVVGKRWRFLTALVVMFTAGYLLTPFFDLLPQDMMRLIVSLIFLFGAIYVMITVRLVHTIIRELTG